MLTSIIGLLIIPRYSCPESRLPEQYCDVESQNIGWRIMLGVLGVVVSTEAFGWTTTLTASLQSISMFLCRIVFFRLQESPKFLTASLRHSEAVIALQRISRINGEERSWGLKDVVDHLGSGDDLGEDEDQGPTTIEIRTTPPSPPESSRRASPLGGDYEATGEMRNSLSEERERREAAALVEEGEGLSGFNDDGLPSRISIPVLKSRGRGRRKEGRAWIARLPPNLADSVDEYFERLDELFEDKWRKTTVLVWMIWLLASAGYTVSRQLGEGGRPAPRQDS